MDALTQYYFHVEVRVNLTIYISRISFMTGEFATRLTDANIGLLIIGLLFLILGILIFLVWIPLFRKCDRASDKHVWIVLSLVILPVFLWLVSICLWIAVGVVVEPQINTCDSKWQSNRDNLIIAAFVFSFISLLLFVTATIIIIYKKAHFKKKMGLHCDNEIELEEQENTFDEKFGNDKPSQEPASKCQQCGSEFSIIKWNRPHYCGGCGKIIATPALFGAKEPEWDIESDVCYVCTTKVTSESRNNCRACGKVVCKKCSKNKAYVQCIGNTVMVCSHCHRESKKKGDLHMKSNAEETTV